MTAGVGERSDSGHTEVFFFYFFFYRALISAALRCVMRRAAHGMAWRGRSWYWSTYPVLPKPSPEYIPYPPFLYSFDPLLRPMTYFGSRQVTTNIVARTDNVYGTSGDRVVMIVVVVVNVEKKRLNRSQSGGVVSRRREEKGGRQESDDIPR